MAKMIINLKVRPDSPETDLEALKKIVKEILTKNGSEGEITISEQEIAFGLKELMFKFNIDESKELDPIETEISDIEEVSSVQVAGMSRALG